MALETTPSAIESVGKYDVVEKIAEGGMGAVFRGRERDTGRTVAIKIVPAHLTGNAVMMKRFEQEYAVSKTLVHPNIVRAIDFGHHDGSPYLVMEFIEGESLGQRVEREKKLPEADAIRLVAQVAQGLHKAHKLGLVHRDVKPDNILVTTDGVAKLADLGLVKELETDLNLTRTGRGLGTPFFMAPEQFRNAKNADARCDIYSLAATLYMLVTGELPFKSYGPLDAWMKKINNELTPARQLVPTLSERVDWAIQRAMSADPHQRPSTCREFVEDLTGHGTRKITPLQLPKDNDYWYLVYKDEDGVVHTVKGTLPAIRRSVKEGLLGDANQIRACHTKAGPFELFRSHPEFRDLVVSSASLALSSKAQYASKTPTPPKMVDVPPHSSSEIHRTPIASRCGDRATTSASAGARSRDKAKASDRVAASEAAPVLGRTSAIHINLVETIPNRWAWVTWVVLAIAALSTGAVGYFLLPVLLRLRLF